MARLWTVRHVGTVESLVCLSNVVRHTPSVESLTTFTTTIKGLFFAPFHFYLQSSIKINHHQCTKKKKNNNPYLTKILSVSAHPVIINVSAPLLLPVQILEARATDAVMVYRFLRYCCSPATNPPNTIFTQCTCHKEFGKCHLEECQHAVNHWWVSKRSTYKMFLVSVDAAECLNGVQKRSAESQTHGWNLSTRIAFSGIKSLSSSTCFFKPWANKMQIDKTVHVSMVQLKIQIYFHVWIHFK